MGKSQKEGVYLTIELPQGGYISFSNAVEYRVNKGRWISLNAGATTVSAPTSGVYNPFEFRAKLTPAQDVGVGTFTIYNASRAYISGNCMSLLFGDDAEDERNISGYDYAFCRLFANVSATLYVNECILPARILSDYCYAYMFENSNIYQFDDDGLPAIYLADSCYYGMFLNCVNLINVPTLDAYTLERACYGEMFKGCTSITQMSRMRADKLADYCYFEMFSGCTSLMNVLSFGGEEGFGHQSCSHMFYGCTSLTSVLNPIDTAVMGISACWNMFRNCTNLTSVNRLGCSVLAASCYDYMFYGCSKLNSIKMLATDVSAYACLDHWVDGVASSGTFTKHPNASLPTGVSGIPNGWTVRTATS